MNWQRESCNQCHLQQPQVLDSLMHTTSSVANCKQDATYQ